MVNKEVKKWWEYVSKRYQDECKIPVDIHYGPGSPNENSLKLLGNLRGKHILEIGCGGAQCGIAMAKKGAKVIGIDLSEEQLKFAKKLAEKNKAKIDFRQGDIKNLKRIKSNSQDIVFSAWALFYVDDLLKCFKEVRRVLKKNGLFVFSLEHPFYDKIDGKTLRFRRSYFLVGKRRVKQKNGKIFVEYIRSLSDYYNYLVKAEFSVEKILEPDSRKRYSYDPWYGMWNYTPKLMKLVPPTIIFKARK